MSEKCDLAYEISYNPVYRFSQFYTFIISLIAIPGLLYFLVKRIFYLPFHGNLKCLLVFYFFVTFLFAIAISVGIGYNVINPFFIEEKCDLIMSQTFYKYGHFLMIIVMVIPMTFPFGFTIERFVALICTKNYEHTKTILGPILVTFLIVTNIIIVLLIFNGETFNDPFISLVLVPAKSALHFNYFLFFLIGLKAFNLIGNVVLLMIHRKLEKRPTPTSRYHRQSLSLSARYEMEEISVSSKFTLIISFSHLLFFGWYVVSTLIMRTVGESFFGGYVNYMVARGIYCVVPTYNLVIVFIGTYSLRHLNLRRHNKVQNTVQMKSTGSEGVKNYHDAISNHWDTIFNEKTA